MISLLIHLSFQESVPLNLVAKLFWKTNFPCILRENQTNLCTASVDEECCISFLNCLFSYCIKTVKKFIIFTFGFPNKTFLKLPPNVLQKMYPEMGPGKVILCKNQHSKISWQCPFKAHVAVPWELKF